MPAEELELEWTRMEILAACLLDTRRGKEPSDDQARRLQELQLPVRALRQGDSPWRRLPLRGLPALAYEALACVFASEANPAVGLLYQELQANHEPYPSIALLQALLALERAELHELRSLLMPGGELVRRGLIELQGEGAFTPLKPASDALALLLGWPRHHGPLPGASLVARPGSWKELVLPQDRLSMLEEYLLWLRHRHTVVSSWGGRATGGPIALFAGPSGTGKTLAASVLASELGWPLYRVDLAHLVSKYVGETEKNIARLLDAASGKQLVLQFDEVDALMSRRSEVKDPRDRYANMEVSYLLTRLESHDGPCVLTTNLRGQIDKAFFRRFQMVVEFPRPDAPARARLWDIMLPPRGPRAPGVDLEVLASVNLTGGSIHNAALHAAYLAAGAERPIELEHIAVGVFRELAKERPRVTRSDLGHLAQHLPSSFRSET